MLCCVLGEGICIMWCCTLCMDVHVLIYIVCMCKLLKRSDSGGSINLNAQVFEVSSSVFMSVVQCRRRFNSASTDQQCW